MAESWLNNNYSYSSTVCTSSADLQAAIAAAMIAAGWSNPSANTYKSPDANRWVQVVFSQPAADKLEIDMTEYLGRVAVDGRVGTVSNPSTWKVHVNTFGFMVWNSSGNGFCYGGILDHYPQPATSHTLDVYFSSYLTNADAATGENSYYYRRLIYNNTFQVNFGAWPAHPQPGSSGGAYKSVTLARRDTPWYVFAETSAGVTRLVGRAYQMVQCDQALAKDSTFRVSIDSETVAEFIVTGVPTTGSYEYKLAVRK